ncbi:MAG: DUF1611 domain-containing protein [Pseudomonadota bacterium]|nr:DUF1611 domain-containing protein [Pseudomonadota bacterium]
MAITPPYLVFLGDAPDRLIAKTGAGIVDWAPERCAGQLRLGAETVDLGLPDMTIAQAQAAGVKTLVVGTASPGGQLDDSWLGVFREALGAGLDIAAGLHIRLNAVAELRALADAEGCTLTDLRDPPPGLPIGSGVPRTGHRVLTVGTDCAVGKKYTALAIWRALRERGADADFCATGQTGVLISGRGFAIDSVIGDFMSGAAEVLAPAADAGHWDVIEGQGSLFHPAYAGVSLGLIHGAQPEAIVLCHEAGREAIAFFAGYPTPPLDTAIARNLEAARLTSPDCYCAGVSLNTAALEPRAAQALIADTSARLGLPVIDPVRTGADAIASRLLQGGGTS